VFDRTVLPLQEPNYPKQTELDARKATPPPRFEVKAPQGAPNVLIVLIKGRFDAGWDAMREATLARQITLGVVPAGTTLAAKPEAIKDWDKRSAGEKKLFARQMEVFAGLGEYADAEVGRLIDAIGETGQLDNTLVFFILGDNGTSAEGGMNGMFSEMTYFNGVQ
jgi:arylsulfatase